MPFHKAFLFPIIIAVSIGAILLITNISFFGLLEKRILMMMVVLMIVGSFGLVFSD
jgi:hypothetical protein